MMGHFFRTAGKTDDSKTDDSTYYQYLLSYL